MINLNWNQRRKEAQRTGIYNSRDLDRIKLDLSRTDIMLFLDDYNITSFPDVDYIIEHLKLLVYLNRIPNNKDVLLQEIIRFDEELESMFPKLFWNEYLYSRHDLSWKELNKRIRKLERIKSFLDEHKEYRGLTGMNLQEKYNHKLGRIDVSEFSWRAWGLLMASYMNTIKHKRLYDYMNYYV